MEEFKQQFIHVAYSEFGIKAIESINFEQAFAILDKMQQLRTSAERSEQLVCSRCNENEKQKVEDPYCIECKIEIEEQAN